MSVSRLGGLLAPFAVSQRTGAVSILTSAYLTVLLCAAPPRVSAQACAADCNGDGAVSSDEMLVSANVSLGTLSVRSCPSADLDADGSVKVGEAVRAVRASLGDCSAPRSLRPRTPGGPAQIQLGVVAGSAGAQVTFDVTLHDNGNVVAATQNDIAFDPLTPIVDCDANPAIDKDVFIGFQPPGCTQNVDCTGVRVLVLSLSNVDPIPDGSILYSCQVGISFAAPDGTYPLVSSNEGASTPEGQAITTEGIDGAVVVAGGGFCPGDCNGSESVTVSELIIGINILLTNGSTYMCPAADLNGSGTVTVDESIAATGNAIAGCGTHPTGPAGTIPAQIDVGDASGDAGTQTTFDVVLHTNGATVAGTQNDISFNPLTPIIDCEPNDAIDKGATSFAFHPPGCSTGFDCTSVRALVTSLANQDPIPDGAVLYTCTVDIAVGTPNGSYPLHTSNEAAGTPGGRPNPVFGTGGAVIVGGGGPAGTRIIAGSATGVVGEVVTVPVGLETDEDVAGTENELVFDSGTPIVFSSCMVNPDINKPNSAFGFRPMSCMPGVNCSGVKAIIISFSDLSPIPNGSTLYTCDVFILPSAVPGTYPLDCFAPGAATPVGGAIETDCVDGAVTVLPGGPPVAAASLILERARLRANTASGARQNGSLLLSGVVNANPPFGGLTDEILAAGIELQLSGAGGVDFTLSWVAGTCSARQTSRGPKIRCDVEDANGRRRLTLRPTRTPNLLKMKIDGSRLALGGPFTVEAVTATLTTTSFQRPDSIDNCKLRRGGVVTSCRESGVVP